MEQTKITDLLTPLCLQQLYEGEQSGILLILGKKPTDISVWGYKMQDTKTMLCVIPRKS